MRERFATDHIFHPIRIEPYLVATGSAHPDLAPQLDKLAHDTAHTRLALVHGDVSPKNILCGPRGPVFLDAECAWYGDPAFDLAFCLNHLLLKCLWNRPCAPRLLEAYGNLATAYLDGVAWEPSEQIERRTALLLAGLLLARVDGKSPVEYLDPSGRDFTRQVSLGLIASPVTSPHDVARVWSSHLGL